MINSNDFANKTDQELVAFALKEQKYYEHLVKRYEDKLMRYIIRLSGVSKEDAEDILQDVFIKVYIKLNDFDSRFKFSSWIYRIAHNETITHLRKMKIRPRIISSDATPLILNLIKDESDTEKNIDAKLLLEKISKVINNIGEKYKEVLVLKYLEEKDYQEISDILSKPMGTVATLLKRARGKLKKELLKNKISF